MEGSLRQELNSLLALTEELLACAEPSLSRWQHYSQSRARLFGQLQALTPLTAHSRPDAAELQQLMGLVLKKDELVVQKIRHQLSKISQQMIELADQRRVLNAYGAGVQANRSGHLQTA